MPPKGLSLPPRQERFCHLYVADSHATRAAMAAGYAPRTARAQGSRLLSHPGVAARIRDLQAAQANRTCAHVDALMAKLENVYLKALDNHNFQAAGKAVEMQARLAGLTKTGRPGPSDAEPGEC